MSREFIEKADLAHDQKDYEGMTFKNFMYYPKFKLSRAF